VLPQLTTMILRDARVEVGKAIAPPPVEIITPAPTGALPTFVAQGPEKESLQIDLAQDGGIGLKAGQKYFYLSTSTSLPDGKWYETAAEKYVPGKANFDRRTKRDGELENRAI
jgi:hypothetical protein